jgi:hypothetical protein
VQYKEIPYALRRLKDGLRIATLHLKASKYQNKSWPAVDREGVRRRFTLAHFESLNHPVNELVAEEPVPSLRDRIYKKAADRIGRVFPLRKGPTPLERVATAMGRVVTDDSGDEPLGFAFRIRPEWALTSLPIARRVLRSAGARIVWSGPARETSIAEVRVQTGGEDLAILLFGERRNSLPPRFHTGSPLAPGEVLLSCHPAPGGAVAVSVVDVEDVLDADRGLVKIRSDRPLGPGTPLVTRQHDVAALILGDGEPATALDFGRMPKLMMRPVDGRTEPNE